MEAGAHPALRSKHSGSGGEDLLALLTQLVLRSDVPVERHRPDAEFAAQFGHRRVAVGHRGLRTSCRPCVRGPRAALSPATVRLRDQLPLGVCAPLAGEQPQAPRRGRTVHGVDPRWARFAAQARSSFQTTSTSPFRRARKQLSSPGRSSRTPEAKSW